MPTATEATATTGPNARHRGEPVAQREDAELLALVAADAAGSAGDALDELARRYQPLVHALAARLHRGRDSRHDDVVSSGNLGLLKAIRDFDPGRGVHFAAYARAKVRGEMLRWFRDTRYDVRVPRPLHERHMQVRAAQREIEQVGLEPSTEDVARWLGTTPAEVLDALAVADAERFRGGEVDTTPDASAALATRLEQLDLHAAILELDERLRLVLYRRYWQGCTQSDVGEELALSQAHVSRLEKRAIARLLEQLRPEGVAA